MLSSIYLKLPGFIYDKNTLVENKNHQLHTPNLSVFALRILA